MKVVFHIDEESRWDMLLGNVRNFLKEKSNSEIAVVANGSAVKYYMQTASIDDVLLDQVDFVACSNALANNDINIAVLDDRIRVVNAGVVELVRL